MFSIDFVKRTGQRRHAPPPARRNPRHLHRQILPAFTRVTLGVTSSKVDELTFHRQIRPPFTRVTFFSFLIALEPRVESYKKSMSLKYEPSSEPHHNCLK